MKFSLKWLRDYVDIEIDSHELADKLTMAGLEVANIEIIGSNWNNILVGKIVAVNPHPNADRLRLTTVDLGNKQVIVVCGAPNLHLGDHIAFAQVGAMLFGGHTGELAQLKPAKIRGVSSEGMICSEKELGISENHEGILVLPPDSVIGDQLEEYLADTIFDIEITPNRPDCYSVMGVAREIAALTDKKFRVPEVHYAELEKPINNFASVAIVESDLCPRYVATLIKGVKVCPSPRWMQDRLLTYGMRPINNIVDITNYVMIEYGQPLHAFDFDTIHEGKIIVRRAKEKEIIVSLDGSHRTLDKNMLVIADPEHAVAIAGIMGGLETEVTEKTTNILLEAANFNQAIIYRGSKELKLSDEASSRFEKGLNLELPAIAIKRATQLLLELGGGKVAEGIIDAYPGKSKREPLSISAGDVKRLLGMEMSLGEIINPLERLGLNCARLNQSVAIVDLPWWRNDLGCSADLVEEVARITGYDNIPAAMLSSALPTAEHPGSSLFIDRLKNILVACGFQEVLTYPLTSLEILSKLSNDSQLVGPEPARVAHPMSKDLEYLRTSLRAGIISVLARNQRFRENNIKIFEIGRIFISRKNDLPVEKEMLCAIISNVQPILSWHQNLEPVDFFDAKGIVETLLSRIGYMANFVPGDDKSLSPGRVANIIIGEDRIGVVGELHPKVLAAFDLADAAYLIELDVDKLLSSQINQNVYQQIAKYPGITRDLALLVDNSVIYQQIYSIIKNQPLVNQVILFDRYSGEQVPEGKQSMAFRIFYQAADRTLTDPEVDKMQQQILNKLSKELGASLRS